MAETKKSEELVDLDLESESSSYSQVLTDIKKLGKLEIVSFSVNKPKRVAQVTGQKGTYLFDVRGSISTWLLGADSIAKLKLDSKLPVMMNPAERIKIEATRSLTVLKNALKRQKDKRAV